MSTDAPASVTDLFYGLSQVAEGVEDDAVDRWLGALVLLLAEELGDRDRAVALAHAARRSVARSATPQ